MAASSGTRRGNGAGYGGPATGSESNSAKGKAGPGKPRADVLQVIKADKAERIERLNAELKGIGDDVRDVYAEAKAVGYDPKIIRKVVRIRKQDRAKRQEEEAILDLYLAAIGEI